MYNEVNGNLITLGSNGHFDVIVHGCNCWCIMGAGIAPQMAKAFRCNDYKLESNEYQGDINKLGQIDYGSFYTKLGEPPITFIEDVTDTDLEELGWQKNIAINAYTQFDLGRNHKDGKSIPVDYEAIKLCMRKINYIFKGAYIGLPQIGAGLAGGDWNVIKKIIKEELIDCSVTVVIFDNLNSKV